jgi:hypothetical protein
MTSLEEVHYYRNLCLANDAEIGLGIPTIEEVRQQIAELMRRLGREPTDDELAELARQDIEQRSHRPRGS